MARLTMLPDARATVNAADVMDAKVASPVGLAIPAKPGRGRFNPAD